MRTINKLVDLEAFGIYPLTGEACGLMMRILCDFDENGRRILAKRFGVPDFKGSEPWNSATRGHKHVGSIMLTAEDYLHIGVFALLSAGYKWVYEAHYREYPPTSVSRLRNALRKFLVIGTKTETTDVNSVSIDAWKEAVAFGNEVMEKSPSYDYMSIWVEKGTLYGFHADEEERCQDWANKGSAAGWSFRGYSGGGDADDGFRHRHQMSGREV